MTSPYTNRRERRRKTADARTSAITSSKAAIKMAVPTGENFASCYMELCKQQRVRPLPVICVTLPQSLDFTTDRVKMDDWGPILNSLTLDRSLRSISVRSRYQCRKPLEEINSADKARTMGKAPVVLSRYLLEWLSQSVAQCVRNSPVLTCLELEGIPLPSDCLASLCVGLASTETLRHLSLQRCYIGDKSCELVCRTIADVPSIRTLNLSHCDLSNNCGSSLAAALSRQKLSLYHDTWKQSLRYREPNLEAMPGLRRLTLNGNPRLGDLAVSELIEAIRDSLWLKALDIRQCGLTERTAREIIELLDSNKTLSVIDVRMNTNLRDDLAEEIYRRLEANNAENGRSDYRWLSLPRGDSRNAVSADAKGRRRHDEANNDAAAATRPKSAYVPKTRRSFVTAGLTKEPTVNTRLLNGRSSRAEDPKRSFASSDKPAVPLDKRIDGRTIKENESSKKERSSLHVDLRVISTAEETVPVPEKSRAEDVAVVIEESRDKDEKASSHESESVEELNRVLRQLSEARMEHDRLVAESQRAEALLAEERSRRENAELKVEFMKRDLTDIQGALKKTESETRGFLLISQRSLDDMAESFDRVLDMLDQVARNSRLDGYADGRQTETEDDVKHATQDYSRAREEMRRRVARLIRKTKSESHHRGGLFTVECDETSVIQASIEPGQSAAKKMAKSESDVRNSLPPIVQTIRLESNIGDSPDVASSLARRANREMAPDCHEMTDYQKMASPCARARAIFAQIVNGESFVHLGAHGS